MDCQPPIGGGGRKESRATCRRESTLGCSCRTGPRLHRCSFPVSTLYTKICANWLCDGARYASHFASGDHLTSPKSPILFTPMSFDFPVLVSVTHSCWSLSVCASHCRRRWACRPSARLFASWVICFSEPPRPFAGSVRTRVRRFDHSMRESFCRRQRISRRASGHFPRCRLDKASLLRGKHKHLPPARSMLRDRPLATSGRR